MQSYSAVFELVEWRVVAFVDICKVSFKSVEFIFILGLRIDQLLKLSIQL